MVVLIFVIYYCFPKSPKIYFGLLCASLLFTSLNLEQFNSFVSGFAPALFERKLDVYASSDYQQQRLIEDTKSIHVLFYQNLIKWLFRFLLLFIFVYHKKIIYASRQLSNLYSYSCLVAVFAAIMAMVPSASRFLYLEAFLTFSVASIVLSKTNVKHFLNRILRFAFALCFLYFIFFQLRSMMSFVGISLFLSNPLLALLIEDNNPILFLFKY